jgi:glucose-6-phosphate isomerase
MDGRDMNEDDFCYSAYREIVFEKDRDIFEKHALRYDITLIGSGSVNNERYKTSGHYHGYIGGRASVYPEVYEVISGTAVYILQKVPNFDKNEEPIIEELIAVTVEEGQAVIIPAFYGHCSCNAGSGPLIFSNIAAVACPVLYDPIKSRHGLACYLVSGENSLVYARNPNYKTPPPLRRMTPLENASLGIEFGRPVYGSFVRDPGKFDFMLNPDKYEDSISKMMK